MAQRGIRDSSHTGGRSPGFRCMLSGLRLLDGSSCDFETYIGLDIAIVEPS